MAALQSPFPPFPRSGYLEPRAFPILQGGFDVHDRPPPLRSPRRGSRACRCGDQRGRPHPPRAHAAGVAAADGGPPFLFVIPGARGNGGADRPRNSVRAQALLSNVDRVVRLRNIFPTGVEHSQSGVSNLRREIAGHCAGVEPAGRAWAAIQDCRPGQSIGAGVGRDRGGRGHDVRRDCQRRQRGRRKSIVALVHQWPLACVPRGAGRHRAGPGVRPVAHLATIATFRGSVAVVVWRRRDGARGGSGGLLVHPSGDDARRFGIADPVAACEGQHGGVGSRPGLLGGLRQTRWRGAAP